MPSGQRHLATGLAYGSTSPLDELRRNYSWRETGTPEPEEPSPQEIVARLHGVIAAKSPEHAAMVAEFERGQAAKAAAR